MTEENQKSTEKSLKPEIGSPEWTQNWIKERKVKRIAKATALKDLGAYLKDLGYKYIRVWYEGSGDSGECYEAEGWKDEIDLKGGKKWPDPFQTRPYNHNKKEDFDEWKV